MRVWTHIGDGEDDDIVDGEDDDDDNDDAPLMSAGRGSSTTDG